MAPRLGRRLVAEYPGYGPARRVARTPELTPPPSDHHRLAHLPADGDELAAVHQGVGPDHSQQGRERRGELRITGVGLVEVGFGYAVEDGERRGPLRLPELLVLG